MLFGHNTNLTVEGVDYHVQTEDRGEAHALLDTAVYWRGRVMHHRKSSYQDLLPLNEDRLQELKLRLDDQHRTVLEEIRSGVLQFTAAPASSAGIVPPRDTTSTAKAGIVSGPPAPESAASPEPDSLKLEFRNPKTWLKCNQATLHIGVHDRAGKPASARVEMHVEGAATPTEASAETGPLGGVLLEFAMPHSVGGELTFIIEASAGAARGQLRFQLKAKPRVPATE